MIAKKLASVTLAAGLGLLTQRVLADDYTSPTDDRVRISVGAMHVSSSTTLQADSSTGVTGTQINGEDQFGLDKSDVEPKLQVMVRAAVRHRFSFDYFTLDRSGNSIVGATPIVFRDVTFLPNDPLQTQLTLRTFGITYEYSFWHSERLEIAATVGVHATDISALAKVETQTRHLIQTEDQAGPVPTVGLDATWVVSRRFTVEGRGQYFDIHVHNLDGSLGLYEFNGLYRYRPNIYLGVGYTQVDAHLTSVQTSQHGVFDFNSKGPQIFLRVAF